MAKFHQLTSKSLFSVCLATLVILFSATGYVPHHFPTTGYAVQHAEENALYSLHWKQINITERQYNFQRGGRIMKETFLRSAEANFPCQWGEAVVGSPATDDGNKWVCGISLFKNPCVVYSFGSGGKFEFELGLLELLPQNVKCEVHVFDHTSYQKQKIPKLVTYHRWGLAEKDDIEPNLKSLKWIMKELNHSHLDVLKIDAEGAEWSTLGDPTFAWPSVGQLQLEIHFFLPEWSEEQHRRKEYSRFLSLMEKRNMRLFHTEQNYGAGPNCCTELAFIHKDWTPNTKSYI